MKVAALVAALLVAVAASDPKQVASADLKHHALSVYKAQMEKSPCAEFFSAFYDDTLNCTDFVSGMYTNKAFHETMEIVVKELAEQSGGKVDEKKVLVCERSMKMKVCFAELKGMLNADLSLNVTLLLEAANKIQDAALRAKLVGIIDAVNNLTGNYPVKAIAQLAFMLRELVEACATEEQKAIIASYKEKIAQGKTPEEAAKELAAEMKGKKEGSEGVQGEGGEGGEGGAEEGGAAQGGSEDGQESEDAAPESEDAAPESAEPAKTE